MTPIKTVSWTNETPSCDDDTTTVTLSVDDYNDDNSEYTVRIHSRKIVQNGKRFESTIFDSVETFELRVSAIESFNNELLARNCPDYDAKRIAVY